MNIKFWLNGIQRQEEVDPGMLLIDFLREKGCTVSREAVRQQTVVFVLYGWMESRFCHVPHLPFVQMDVM